MTASEPTERADQEAEDGPDPKDGTCRCALRAKPGPLTAVCAVCNLTKALEARLREERVAALREAADQWRDDGRGVMFNKAKDDLTPAQRVGKWLRERATVEALTGEVERRG